MELIKTLPEATLAAIVAQIERGNSLYNAIEQVCGKYEHVKTSSEEYSKRKLEEKKLEL